MPAEKQYRQSGVIPFRHVDGNLEVLLITSRGGNKWVIPKGLVEKNLSPLESARKEAMEEAGIEGTIFQEPVGFYEYSKWNGRCRVEVFAMEVEQIYDEWDEDWRIRMWHGIAESAIRVTREGVKPLLRSLPEFLNGKTGP